MRYSKEEVLTIGKFFEIPNIDQKKTARQLKVIIDKWFDKGIERAKLIDGGESLELAKKRIMLEKEFIQLAQENLHLSLDLKLEKLSYFCVEKLKQHQQRVFPDFVLNHPNFVEFDVWYCKKIFYSPIFGVVSFKHSLWGRYLALYSTQHRSLKAAYI